MSGRTCSTCQFWQKTKDGSVRREALGECRKNAPKPGDKNFPETESKDWCGEYQEE